jgi:hypothetical protein
METIDKFIEFRLNDIYGDPSDKANRVVRTIRAITTFEFTYSISVDPHRDERQYVREILDMMLENMKRDFHLRSMNRSWQYRTFARAIAAATDTQQVISTIQEAYQTRVKGTLSVKMFTALNTAYKVKRAALESEPVKALRVINGRERTFILAVPFIALARSIRAKDLRVLATEIHTLPAQERERVRKVIQTERPDLYSRILDGLLTIVEQASQRKRMYLRFAFYEDTKTGRPNEAHNMIHLLSATDKATVWQRLKALSGVAEPAAA